MHKYIVAFAWIACCAAPALAQSIEPSATHVQMETPLAGEPPAGVALAPVDSLTCEQMTAEMMLAGQQMNAQLDPNFATDVQAMQDQGAARMREAQAGALGAGLVCAIPGLGMACMAAQQAQVASQMAHADEDRARMDHITGTVNNAMAGIDTNRMQALNTRFERQHCPMPQAPQ